MTITELTSKRLVFSTAAGAESSLTHRESILDKILVANPEKHGVAESRPD